MTPTRRDFLTKVAHAMAAISVPSAVFGDTKGGSTMERAHSDTIRLPAHYYQQFDADYSLDVPGEGYGGWKKSEIDISREHTALVVMHAWDTRGRDKFPGWYRAVEYLPRAEQICKSALPRLLSAVRESGFKVFHVVGGGDYYREYPGYRRAVRIAGPEPREPEKAKSDPILAKLHEFRRQHVFVGLHNEEDVKNGFAVVDFPEQAKPVGDEGVAENAHQLFALCKAAGVNHLVYCGFAVNWCLLMSPGGMMDMSRRGVMCSVIRQATTAVENKESARKELHKEEALWRVSLAFGFVFDVDDFIAAVRR